MDCHLRRVREVLLRLEETWLQSRQPILQELGPAVGCKYAFTKWR